MKFQLVLKLYETLIDHVFWNKSRRVIAFASSPLLWDGCGGLVYTDSDDKYSATLVEFFSGLLLEEVSKFSWSTEVTVIWFKDSKDELRVRVPDTTVISSLSSIVDSREHTDLAVCECNESCLDLCFTLLHQLCRDSLTLSVTKAFLHREPICSESSNQNGIK